MLTPRANPSRRPMLGRRQLAILRSARAGWRSGAPALTGHPKDSDSARLAADRGLLRRLTGLALAPGINAWAITQAGLAALARYERHTEGAIRSDPARGRASHGARRASKQTGSARDRAASKEDHPHGARRAQGTRPVGLCTEGGAKRCTERGDRKMETHP